MNFPKTLLVDTETTGLPLWSEIVNGEKVAVAADDPRQPRICELAAILLGEDGEVERTLSALIKPDGWAIPAEVQAIHGITTELCEAEGRPILDVLGEYEEMWAEAELISAFGTTFDLKLLRGELRRAGKEDRYAEKDIFCCMKTATNLCKIAPTEKMMASGRKYFKTPNLTEAAEILLGKKHEGAHRAMADLLMTVDLFRWMHANGHVKPQAQPVSKPKPKAAAVDAEAVF